MSADPTHSALTPSAATTSLILRAALLWSVLVLVGAAAYFYSDAILWSVVGPLVACATVTLCFLVYLRRIEGAMPYFEIGAFYAVVVFLYCAYPLVVYVINGYAYPQGSDWRLILMQYRPDAIGTLSWWYVLYLVCFCVAYMMVRGRPKLALPLRVRPPDAPTITAIAVLLMATWVFFLVLGWFFNMSTASYFDQYLVIQRLPHVVRQFAAHVRLVGMTLQMMLVIALCSARRTRYNIVLVVLLMLTAASHIIWPRARLELFSVLLAAIAAYHLTVRRIPFRWAAVGALTAFVGLLALGPLRASGSHSFQEIKAQMGVQTEFGIILGNALDLKYLQNISGGFLNRPNLYWSGILAMIPQQLMPIEKDTPADWYAREYYNEYYRIGGGLAFGVLAEAVMGFGVWEVVWRGALVGALLGLLHRRLLRGTVSLALVMFYLWMMVWSYQTVRGGTLMPLMFLVYHFITPLLAVTVLGGLLRRGRRAARHLAVPPRAAGSV